MDGSTAGPQRERPLSSPDSSIVGTFDPIAFGPSVASPPPCNWRRPRLAVAGAGIADKQGASLKPFEYCKVIITYHLIFGMGKRIFRDALRARFLLSISLRGECRPWRRKKRSEIAASQRRSSLSLSTSDMSAAACSPHTRLKTPVA